MSELQLPSAFLAGCPSTLREHVTRVFAGSAQLVAGDESVLPTMEATDVLLIGPEVSHPIAAVQSTFRRHKDTLMVIAYDAAVEPAVTAALRMAPFVPITARGVCAGDHAAVVWELSQSLAIALTRRRHRQRMQAANHALRRVDGSEHHSALMRAEALRAAITQAAMDAIVTVDHRGRIVEFNAAAESMFGYTAREALGCQLAELIVPEELRARHREGFQRCLEGGNVPLGGGRVEFNVRRRDGSAFPVELSVVRLPGVEPPLFTGFVRDVSDRVAARQAAELRARAEASEAVAEQRRRWADSLQRANNELEAFSYSVSHDLRAPLRAIDGFSRALLEGSDSLSDEQRHYLSRVRAGAGRMADMIDALLRLSRVSRTRLRRVELDLGEVALDVAAELRQADPTRQVTVSVAGNLKAVADRDLLRIVLNNLLGNAWKFTRPRPDAAIEIRADRQGDETVYSIKDNGVGFDMQYANQLFAPFERLHTDAEFEGTGIGLATAQRIIARHAGRIWAEATAGEGASFFFTLPPQEQIDA